MYDISRRALREITTKLPQQERPLFSPRAEKEIMETEEGLPRPLQREFLPTKKLKEGQQKVPLISIPSAPLEEEKPILLEPEEIQHGQFSPQTGSGIPIGGGTRRIRRRPTIGRKPKCRRKYVRPRIRRQRRRRTIRRRTRR
jgi:hypothetical protein